MRRLHFTRESWEPPVTVNLICLQPVVLCLTLQYKYDSNVNEIGTSRPETQPSGECVCVMFAVLFDVQQMHQTSTPRQQD